MRRGYPSPSGRMQRDILLAVCRGYFHASPHTCDWATLALLQQPLNTCPARLATGTMRGLESPLKFSHAKLRLGANKTTSPLEKRDQEIASNVRTKTKSIIAHLKAQASRISHEGRRKEKESANLQQAQHRRSVVTRHAMPLLGDLNTALNSCPLKAKLGNRREYARTAYGPNPSPPLPASHPCSPTARLPTIAPL